MSRIKFHIILFCILIWGCWSSARSTGYRHAHYFRQDTTYSDTTKTDSLRNLPYEPSKRPTYRQKDRFGDPFSNNISPSPLLLQDPASLQMDLEIDTGMNYTIYEKIGDINYRPTSSMTFQEFNRYRDREMIKDYWKGRSAGLDGESAVSGRRLIPKLYISPVFDRIFGGSYVDIQPNGFVNLDFGGRWQRVDNPDTQLNRRSTGGFNYDQQISMNVVGKVGEKLAITANFDNNNSFDFQNNLKVEYTGYEEDIIKKIEIGNVSMPVANSLMTGGQSLFGIKTQLQFGKLFVTAVASRQQGRSEVLPLENGFQGREFEVRASDYDENRHFFLGHFFRGNYENWLSRLPQVVSSVNITRLEVYIANRTGETETLRNFVALMDLGEGSNIHNATVGARRPGPNDNEANNLFATIENAPDIRNIERVSDYLGSTFPGMTNTNDFERITAARKLDEREYTWNRELGYITLLRKLNNDEVLAVSYEYSFNGQTYKVGELSEDYQGRPDDDLIILKMLRPSKINTEVPTWDLMMKNIYNLNATQVSREGFELRIQYRDDLTGIDNPSLHVGALTKDIPLLQVLGLDSLNVNGDRQRDGNFDFIEGLTIDTRNGNVIFPVLEPFGSTLESRFLDNEQELKDQFVFDTLYRTTRINAQQIASKNKFFIVGKYIAGSGSVKQLEGFNIAEGSVIVTAGNTPLTEGLDYTVNYNLGQVNIINEAILNSGKDIQIAYEKADLFNFQTRWLTGARFDYRFSDQINLGATILHLNERPGGISRFSIGDEPTRNTKYGFDLNFQQESRWMTKMIDALPLLNTKEQSSISFNGEFAQILPGTSNIVNGDGTSYIDDFESAATPFNMGGGHLPWKLGSTPVTEDGRFDLTANGVGNLGFGYKRAKIAWYQIDNTFYLSSSPNRPDNISNEDAENHFVKQILPREIFRQQSRQVVQNSLPIFEVAYFPHERGPYNYNPDLTPDGLLRNPESNYGAITRAITGNTNFNESNIQYIQFWLMDPFLGVDLERGAVLDGIFNQPNNSGGELIFNLGQAISEDVLKDNRQAFENGLPPDGSEQNTTFTDWGKITTVQPITNFFDNSSDARPNQDVGLDGLKSSEETNFFADAFVNRLNLNATGDARVRNDISGDDFRYFLDPEYDGENAKILERYKNFNGMEGNSPIQTSGSFVASGTNLPDKEAFNANNTLVDVENYFEYKIDLRPGLSNGQEFIVDQVRDDDDVSWYLFRIPLDKFTRKFGDLDFQTIRYMRMYLTGWRQPVVLRMANFQLVGSQWRRSTISLRESGFNEIPETATSDFEVSVVNIEENSVAAPGKSPYTLPPGISRDLDNTTAIQRQANEQSLQICVDELEDGDARAVFKNPNPSLDLIQYGRLQMFFHAEANNDAFLVDDDLRGFIRFGTQEDNHYYEIEVPLKITPADVTDLAGPALQRAVWPAENEIDIAFQEFYSLKSRRNREEFDLEREFVRPSANGKYNLKVIGNPDMSTVVTMMIGVRNPRTDDLQSKSVCVWANELRVSDFDTQKGWAANARMSAKLADFATVNASTRYTSIGFGGIQQRISERTREETFQYDLSANVNLDKLIPGNTGLKIPMYVSYEKATITPKFDPLDPDITLDASIQSFDTEAEKEEYKKKVEDRTTRRSINFTNVRKEKTKQDAKSRIYDIENLSFNYSYSEVINSNVNTESFVQKQYRGGFAYNFSPTPPSLEPFKNSKKMSSPYLQLIKDLNFSPLPTNISVRMDLDRRFSKRQLRNSDLTTDGIEPYFEKYFTFNRLYNVRWNLFKSLSLDYSARANAIIDEPEGDINTQAKRDSIWTNIKNFGRLKTFDQNINANYRLPLSKFPLTDWLSADVRYAAGYSWRSASFDQIEEFGHIIQNNRDRSLNGKVDMVKLYNKVKFLKSINTPPRRRSPRSAPAKRDTTRKANHGFAKGLLRTMMSLRSINVTYSVREGTSLPGFGPRPYLFGLDSSFNAPGTGFIFGSQDPNIRFRAADEGWLVRNPLLTTPFTQNLTEDLSIRASIEPLPDIKIQLDFKRTDTGNFQELFRLDSATNQFASLTPSRSGSYSISFLSINTAFASDDANDNSPVFQDFESFRSIIQSRLNASNPAGEYSINSQDVLVPAFIAAYGGRNPASVSLTPFPRTPLPNWRLDYAGLSKIPKLKELFSSVNITHAYSSTFSIGNYVNSNLYQNALELDNSITNYPQATISNDNGLVPVYQINEVSIAERFSPLIGVNIRTKGRANIKVEWKKERTVSLQVTNSQISEMKSSDISFDFGLTREKMKIPFKIKGRTSTLNNDIQFRMTFTVRDTKTVQRKIDDVSTVTNGNVNFQFRPTMSYVMNNKLNLTMYFERNVNRPKVSNAFNRATTAFGFQMRFSLAQ